MHIFGHRHRAHAARPRPAHGGHTADLVLLVRRCMWGDVEVVDTEWHPAGRAAVAGPRPRRGGDLRREKTVRVRLVRAPGDRDDPAAIDVVSATGVSIGRVCAPRAARMAPAIDRLLDETARTRECAGCRVEVWCTAFVVAEWDVPTDTAGAPDDPGPASLELTLLVDDLDLGVKRAAPELPVLV